LTIAAQGPLRETLLGRKAANGSTLSFIDINESGKISFKTGIILDLKIWEEMKTVLEIED
jgi:hypothetical protein